AIWACARSCKRARQACQRAFSATVCSEPKLTEMRWRKAGGLRWGTAASACLFFGRQASFLAEYLFCLHGGIGVEAIDDRHARRELEVDNLFAALAFEGHDERTQRIAMRADQNRLSTKHMRLDDVHIVRPYACAGILQAFAARRRNVVGAPPDKDLIFAPFGACIILVEARQIAIVTLVERLVANGLQVALVEFFE